MRSRPNTAWILPALILGGAGVWWWLSDSPPAPQEFLVTATRFEKWTPLAGELEAENAVSLRAELDGLSKITWLIEDGTPVNAGEIVARFDPSELEDIKLTLARDLQIAEAELRSLTQAQHPLELTQLESDLRTLRSERQEEDSIRKDTEELVNENLLPVGELERHQLKIAELEARIRAREEQIHLTKTILHPALEQKAKARLTTAETAYARVEERLAKTEVAAPVQGSVYLPRIPIDGERRPPRVGDGLYRNQIFMQLVDLTELVVESRIPEQSLSGIVPGLNARIRFPAFPGNTHEAVITRVAAHPEGESRQYPVTLKLKEPLASLRPGLTAEIEVLEYVLEEALVVPRTFVFYPNGTPSVLRKTGQATPEIVQVRLGDGTPQEVLILEGLSQGNRLLQP